MSESSDSRVLRRRNGRLVACNPCRLRKVACDHSRPICTRCLKRKQGGRCVYPDPGGSSTLTDSRPDSASAAASGTASPPTDRALSAPNHAVVPSPVDRRRYSSISTTASASYSHSAGSGFIGFAAQSTVFEDARKGLSRLGVSLEDTAEPQPALRPQAISFRDLPRPLQESCLFVLRCLPGQSNEQIMFVSNEDGTGRSWGDIAMDRIAQSLREDFDPFLSRRDDTGLESMAAVLCNNTARPFEDVQGGGDDPRAWLEQFCGANLRWESLGLLWAQLVHVSDILDALNNRNVEWLGEVPAEKTAQACLGYCIDACRYFAAGGNDLLLDLCRRKATLDSMIDGDGTLPSHSSASITIAMLLYLGIHALENGPDYTPSLCSENKRRLFCQIYSGDKLRMVFTGRPPLLSARYCSTPIPLDLSDQDLVADPATLARAVEALDEKGWSTSGDIYSATLMRARFMMNMIREEIFEIALNKNARVTKDQLINLKVRQQATFAEFPQCLVYHTDDDMSPNVSTRTLYVKLILRLEHLQNLFFIDKLLIRHGYGDNGELLVWSYELVVLTLKFWTNKDRFESYYMKRNFEWFSMAYAAPGGGVLCHELLQPISSTHRIDLHPSRSDMVQQLSLLVGFLDWVPRTSANSILCLACKKVIQRVLDHHLNGAFAATMATTTEAAASAAADPMHWGFLDQPDFHFELLDSFDWLRPEGQ